MKISERKREKKERTIKFQAEYEIIFKGKCYICTCYQNKVYSNGKSRLPIQDKQ